MGKRVVIAPVGDDLDSLYIGLKEHPADKVVLITPKEYYSKANKTKQELERFKIDVQLHDANSDIWAETFHFISKITKEFPEDELTINVSTGTTEGRCAATCAAFVHGVKAITITGDKARILPVLKFSYFKLLADKKMEILKLLTENHNSLEALSNKTGMSLPLISYHINGNIKSTGLKGLGLVDTKEKRGRIDVRLSPLGELL
ncbi:hypothetical protein KY325_01870, partial [Candidatus Woesearchaeota archaeon]|nr:hypothetical protein [Candidatus Woesearchaeota archaeon]